MVRETRYLIVRNLPENCTEEKVIDHFQRYGKIQSVKLQAAKDNDSGSTATVAFNDIKSAAKAHHAKNNLGEVILRTDYWEGSTGTPVIATTPVTTPNAVRPNYTNASPAPTKPVSTFLTRKKGPEEDPPSNQEKAVSTPVQIPGASTPVTASSALEKLTTTTPSFDHPSRGRPRDRLTKKKFGKLEKNGSFGRHGASTRSLEAVRSQSEAAAAAATAHVVSSANLASISSIAGSGTNGSSGTSGLNPIIVNDSKDINTKEPKDNKDNVSKSAASPSSRNSGFKKSQSQSRSASRSRSRSQGSKSSSSRSDSSGTSSTTSPHKSSNARPLSMVVTKLVNSEPKRNDNDGEKRPLGICVTGLPLRSTDSSLKDGLFHEYKKHGKVTSVLICLEGDTRFAIVSFKKPEDASKALEASQGKVFFGAKIKVTSHEGVEVDDSDVGNDLDEYDLKSTRTLFVGNLEKDTTKEDLLEKFKKFGEIIDVDIKRQGATTAFAFVQYVDITSVVAALKAMEGEHIGINKIKLGFGKSMPTYCVWVDNLPNDITTRTLKSAMTRYGDISYCLIDKNRNRGLIYFTSYDDAQHCVNDIKMRPHFMKKKLQVDFASRECQNNFLDRMEESGQLRANERPDETRSHDKFRQRSFENVNEEGSPSSFYGRTSSSYRRRGRQYDSATYPEESHQTSRRSRRTEDFSSTSSVYYSGKGSSDDYVAELREYEYSKRERREKDVSPRNSSADRRVDSQSRRGSRDQSVDRYEDRQKERSGGLFNSREISPGSEHNSFHSENRYRSSREINRDRYEDGKVDDKDFDRHSRPSRTTSPFPPNHTSLHSHDSDVRRVGSRSQSPTTPLHEDTPRFYLDENYKRLDEDNDYYPRRRDSEDFNKSKSWQTSTKLGAEVIKTVERRKKRTHDQSGLSDLLKSDPKLIRKHEKTPSLVENKSKNLHRQLVTPTRRSQKVSDHPSSPGSSGSHVDSENGSLSEGDLHHLHQEKQHILKELKECEAEVVDASEPDSPRSVARVKSVAVKDISKLFGRTQDEKRAEDVSFRRQDEKTRHSNSKLWNHISDDLSSTREDKHLLVEKEDSIGDNSDSDLELHILTKKKRTKSSSEEETLDRCLEQNCRIAKSLQDRRASCDSKTNSLKFLENSKVTDVSSSCDNGHLFDSSVINSYRTSSVSYPRSMPLPPLDSSPHGDFSSAYSEENTEDSLSSGSLSGKHFKQSPPGSPLGKDGSDSEFSFSKYAITDLNVDDSFSDDSLSDNPHAPNVKEMEERLRCIDEILNGTTNKTSDLTLSSGFANERLRKSVLDGGGSLLSEKKQEPSVIMKQVLAKKSILDQDIIRLRCNNKIDQPAELSFSTASLKSLDISGMKFLPPLSSLSHPVTTSSSSLQPTITTSVASSTSLTSPISTSVLTSSIVSAPISSSNNISPKTAAVNNALLSRLSESSSRQGFLSEKLQHSTNLTLESEVPLPSVCNSSLSSKSVLNSLVQCSPVDSVVDTNLLISPSVGKSTASTSLPPSLSSQQSLTSMLSSPTSLPSTSSSLHVKSTMPQIISSSLPVTSSITSLLSSVTKSPIGATVAAPFTQGPDKSQLTPTVGQEAPHLCSTSFTPEISRTSTNSHLPGSRSSRVTPHKQKDDQYIPCNKHELTVHISKSEDDSKSQASTTKTEVITPDIESPVSVKSETSSNSSVPLSSLDNKANSVLEDKMASNTHPVAVKSSGSENNNVLLLKSPIASADCSSSIFNALEKSNHLDVMDAQSIISNVKTCDVSEWSSKKPEVFPLVNSQIVFGVSTKDKEKELPSPSESSSKGKPTTASVHNDAVTKPLSSAPSTSTSLPSSRQAAEKTDKKTIKSSSHSHCKSPAKSEALFAPDVKPKSSEKTEVKHQGKDSHKPSSSSKSTASSSGEKKVSKTTSKEGSDAKVSGSSKDHDKTDKKSESTHKNSGHETSKTKDSDKNKGKDKKDNSKESEKYKQKEENKKKEEKKPALELKATELKTVGTKEDKKTEKKIDDKKEKAEKEKSKDNKLNLFKKNKPESIELNKKDKKLKAKESSSKEKVGEKKLLPRLSCVSKHSTPDVKSKEVPKSETKFNKAENLKSSEFVKNEERSKPEAKHKTDSKVVSKTESKADGQTVPKKPAAESTKSKKEAERDSSKLINLKVKQKEDKVKEKQKLKDDKDKFKDDKEKFKDDKEKFKDDKEKFKDDKEKLKEDKERSKDDKEKQKEEKDEKEEKEKQKEKKELKEKEEKERIRKEKEEKERQKEREERENREKEEKFKKEKEEKLRKEKEEKERQKEREEREAQKEKERLERERFEKERKEKEERDRQREREEKEKQKEREERERKEREKEERKEKEERERKEKEEKERREKEKDERERKEREKEERERKEREKEERERQKERDEKLKEKEKEEKERKEKEKEEREKKEKERKEKERREKREKERKAKEEKLRKEREEKSKKEKEEKAKKEREEKVKKEEKEKAKKEKREKDKKEKEDKDDDDKDDKDLKKPPPKKPKRNELAVLLDSNDKFQMTFTSMYDRVKTQRNREPEQHKPEPAPKSSFDKFKQNRKQKGNKAKSSLYSCGSNSDLSDDSDMSESESSQKADSIKESKPKKTGQVKKRPHVSSSSSSSCEEDDDALLKATKSKGKKPDKFNHIFSSDSEEDHFPTPKSSSKSKTKPIPKRRKTREDSTESINSREEFIKPHAKNVAEQDSLDDIDLSDDEDKPKTPLKKKSKVVKKTEKSTDGEKRDSSVESVTQKVTKVDRESSVESVSKKSHKSDKEETPAKKLKAENKTGKAEHGTERKSSSKSDVKVSTEIKSKVKDLSKDKKERETKHEIEIKSDSKKDLESKKDSQIKKETKKEEKVEVKKDNETKKESDVEKSKIKEKYLDDLNSKHTEERKKKKEKEDGLIKKKKKKKLDPKAEEESVNSLINKVYDASKFDRERKQKKRPKPSLFDSDSDLATSETSVEITKPATIEERVLPKLDTDTVKTKEKMRESSKDKEILKDKSDTSEKSSKHGKDTKSSTDALKRVESKKKDLPVDKDSDRTIELHKKDTKNDISVEKKSLSSLDETSAKPPKKKKKKKEHDKESEKVKTFKVKKGEEKVESDKKGSDPEKNSEASNGQQSQVVDEFVSFWGHPKPILIPKRLKDTPKADDDKKHKDKDDGKTEEKPEASLSKDEALKEEKNEKLEEQHLSVEEQHLSDKAVKIEPETNEEIIVPISEAETTVTTEQVQTAPTGSSTSILHADTCPAHEDVTAVKDETTIGSSVEIHEDEEYPSLVIDEVSETISDDKKKLTKKEKKLLKQQQEEKDRNSRMDEVIASVANAGSGDEDDMLRKEKDSPSSLQIDSVSNDRELDLSDVINLKCEHKFSSETEHKSIIVSDILFPDDKKKSTETVLPFSAFRKDEKDTKSIPATNKDAEQDCAQKLPTLAKNEDIKTEDGLSKVILPKESVVEKAELEKEAVPEEHKPTEEEIKKKQAEELKKQQEEEEERKAEEERKKIEEEKARQEKEQQAIRDASDEAARAVESLLEFQSGFDQDSVDMEDDLPPLFIEPAEEEPPSEVTLSPSKDKIESEAFFTNAIPEKLTANLDDKLLEETKLLVKGDQSDSKIDALSFFTPPQAIISGFTSPRRNSVVQDRAPEPTVPIPSPQRQMQSPQRQIPQSPQIQSTQIQSPQCQMPSPQKHMPLSPQRQMTSPQRIQSPQRPLQSPLRPLQSPQINLQSPLQSPPFFNKDSKMDRSLMSPNREILVMQELEPSSIQQNQRRTSAGIPLTTPEQAVDSLRRKSQEFPLEPTFHSPRRNTISVPEEATATHLDHRLPHHGASVIYSKKSPHGQSSLPPPVSISLDNAPHDKNFQTPMRNLNIPPHQDCNLLSPKKISPNVHFTDLPADPAIYQSATNKTTLQDSFFPPPKPLFNESLFSHHQKHPTPEQMFHSKPLIHDILKTSGLPDQHIFFTTKGTVAEKPLIAKLPESNFPFSKTSLQEQLFTQVKAPQHPIDNRLPQEPLFSPKSQIESTSYNYGEPVDFLSSPPRNPGEFIYAPNPDVQKLMSVKQGESHDLFNKDSFHAVDSRLNERVEPMQPRRIEGFPASFYQEPTTAAGNLSKFPDNIQQSAFDEEKKNARKRKRISKRSTKEDKAAALAEQQAIEQSVQANVESIHKALTASQAKAAAEKAGTVTSEKKKSVDAYDFEAYTGQELGSQNIPGTDNTNFSDDLRQTRSRFDRGRRRGCAVRRGKNGRGGFTSVVDSQDSLQPFAVQQQPPLTQQTPFSVPNQDQLTTPSHPKHGYIPYSFPSQQQQPSFQRQNSQPVTQSFYPSPQSSSDNNSSMSMSEWQMKQTSLPHQHSQTLQLIPQQQHIAQHQQQTQQQQVKLPINKPDDRSPETNKLDLDSSFGESELVINLDDQPSSIEGKENQNSFSSDGDTPSPATPKAQRSTRARKQPNYKAIASGTIPTQPQARTSRSGSSPRGRSIGAQSPKTNMSPRASSCENVQSSPVVKLEKLEVTRTTRRRKGLGKDEIMDDVPNASFEDWKAKKCDEKKAVSKENIYEFVDNEQEQSLEPNLRTRARKKRASDNQDQSQQGVDYLIGSPPTTSNSSFIPDTKGGYESLAYEPRPLDDVPKQVPLSNVDAVIDAVSKGIFGSIEEDLGQDIPTPALNEQASPPSPIHVPPTTRLTRRSTEAKKEAEQKEIKFTIEPAKSDSRDAGKKGPTVPPLRIKVAHGTPKVEKKEEKHYVIERANKTVGPASEHNEKPPLAFTVKLSDSGTATIKPAGSGNGGNFNSNVSLITKNTSQEGIGMKYGDTGSNLKKELGLFSGLPQNEQQQPSLEHEINKSLPSQVTSWKPVDSVAMDSPITRPSGTLHPKLAAKVQASQESMNNSSSVSLVMQNTLPLTSQPNLPPSTSVMSLQSKPSMSPIIGNNMWSSSIQGNNLNQSSANPHLPLHLQNLSKEAGLLLQRPPSAQDLVNKQPPSAHIQPALRNERNVKGPKIGGIDVNQEMVSKLNPETSQKHPESQYGFTGPVPPAHLGQRSYLISPDQPGIPTSHALHFPNNAFKTSLEMRNTKSPSIPPQTSLKLGSDMGTRTPPVNPGSMLYAGIVSAQPISLSPTTASPEGQVIERLPNPLRVQGESGCQSPLSLRMHPDSARFIKDDLESSVPPSVRGDQNMMFLLEHQRLRQHLLLVQENNRTSNQDQNRNAEVARNMIIAHEQSRNTTVGLDSVRKNALASQPSKLNQPLNLADSDSRGESSRVTPKSTPPAPQSPFSIPYLDRKVEQGRMQVGVTSAFMQPSPSAAREALSHMYQDLPLGLTPQFGMVNRISLDPHMYGPGHQPQAHLLREGVLPSHFSAFTTGPRFPGLEYSDKKVETGHPDQVSARGMLSSPSPNPMLSRQADMLLMKPQQLTRMPSDLPTNSPVGILQRYPVMWQGALALKNDNSYVQMHFIAGNRRLPNQALPQPMQNGALPPLRISQRMRLEQAQLEGVSKRMQCEDDYCILIAVACGRDQSDISFQTRALNEGFINYLLNKQAAGIVNVPLPGSEQAGFVVHIFPPCEFVDNSVAEQGSMALMEQLREVPHAVIIIATT